MIHVKMLRGKLHSLPTGKAGAGLEGPPATSGDGAGPPMVGMRRLDTDGGFFFASRLPAPPDSCLASRNTTPVRGALNPCRRRGTRHFAAWTSTSQVSVLAPPSSPRFGRRVRIAALKPVAPSSPLFRAAHPSPSNFRLQAGAGCNLPPPLGFPPPADNCCCSAHCKMQTLTPCPTGSLGLRCGWHCVQLPTVALLRRPSLDVTRLSPSPPTAAGGRCWPCSVLLAPPAPGPSCASSSPTQMCT